MKSPAFAPSTQRWVRPAGNSDFILAQKYFLADLLGDVNELDASLNELLYVTLNEEPVIDLEPYRGGGGTVIGGRLLVASVILCVSIVGCGGGNEGGGVRLPAVAQQSPGIRVVGAVEAGVEPIPLTKQAVELRRVRDEHLRLIESIPPTLGATPTLTMVEKQDVAVARIMDHPDGVPVGPAVDEDWFNPDLGITFYRDSGGDWTARRVRETHSHRNLFFYSDYPGTIANFADGSIHDALAREMVFEAVKMLPVLDEPTPAMVALFKNRLGWELRDSAGPVVNLWTTFVLRVDGEMHHYSVGGVMLMGVGSVGEGGVVWNMSHRAGGSAR